MSVDWSSLEENEEEFFSLWSDKIGFRDGVLFYNKRFSDDPLFNHLTHIVSDSDSIEELIEESIVMYRSKCIRPCVYISPLSEPKDIKEILFKKGFQLQDKMAIMNHYGHSIKNSSSEIKVEEVYEDAVERWCKTFALAFDIPSSWYTELNKRCKVVHQDSRVKLYVAYNDMEDIGTIAIFSDKGVSGSYCVGTIPSYRERGVATQLLSIGIEYSKRIGNTVLCLQTLYQDDAIDFYRRRGFKEEFTREVYVKELDARI